MSEVQEMKPIADILHEARCYMEKYGWAQDELRINRRVCSIGAIIYSQKLYREQSNGVQNQLVEAAAHALVQAIPDPYKQGGAPQNTVIAWNDDDSRTKQEVLDAFAKAEKIQRTGFDPDEGVVV